MRHLPTPLARRIHALPLKRKFVLMLFLPLAGLLFFNGSMLLEKWRFTHEMDRLREVVGVATVISDFVHQSQLERGRTGVFLDSRGRRFAAETVAQRAETDRQAQRLREALGRYGTEFDRAAGEALGALERLGAVREAVDRFAVGAADARDYYSRLNATLIGLSQHFLVTTTDVVLASRLFGYYNLLQAKEHAGQERALLSRLFLAGRIEPAERERLTALVTRERLFTDYFLAYASPAVAADYRETLRGGCVEEVARLREAALAAAGGALEVDYSHWFDQSTCNIDRLRQVEQRLAEALGAETVQLKEQALGGFLAATGLSLALALVSVWLILVIARGFTEQTHQVSGVLLALSQGHFGRRAEVITGDELGEVARGTNEMAERLAATAAAEREQRERERAAAERLRRQVEAIRAFAAAIAGGDLRRRISVGPDDELAGLADHLNGMGGSLADIARAITASADHILDTVAELQTAINAQSSGASQQAASVNETTTTLEEIRATSGQTREKALALGQLAERMRAEGEQGLAAVEQGIVGMRGIGEKVEAIARTILALSEQTQQVGEITAVVDSLARQSKMLALNAAIEATKAGEAGRGFAVVAGEVKELAEQSQRSTAQVQRILQEIQSAADRAVMVTEEGMKGVESGLELGERTGRAVRSLSRVINETTVASQQIVAAVRQEATGIEQIAAAMQDIQTITGHFVKATRQTGEAVERLGDIAEQLGSSVRSYRI